MRAISAFLLLLAVVAAHGQSVAEAFRAPARSVAIADLPDAYRAVTIGTGSEGFGGTMGLYAFGMMGGGASNDDKQSAAFFSLMGVSFVDPAEFGDLLDGKRSRIRAYTLDLISMMSGAGRSAKVPRPVFAETWIEAGRVTQWSPKPSLTKELLLQTFGAAEAKPAAAATQGLSNVKQIAVGMLMYSQDYDDYYPAANSTAQAQKIVAPYLKNDALWTSPNGGRVLYNTALSHVAQSSIESVAETLLVWEEKPYDDGRRAVAFSDGHAKLLSAAEWEALWAMELQRRKATRSTWYKAGPASPSASPPKRKGG